MRPCSRGLLLALLTYATACTSFPTIEANECGNAVLEAGEDCDSFPRLKGSICRPKGTAGECHFDCRANVDGTRGVCPRDMGCASDGICRPATGEFEAPLQISPDISSWVSSADFDGDGRTEVLSMELTDQLQQGRFRLHYFDVDTKLVETRVFPRVTTRPVAGRLNEDRADDLVFSNFEIGMLPGRRDRAFLPASFSSYVVDDSELRVLPVSEGPVGNVVGLVAFGTIRGFRGVHVPSAGQGELSPRAPLTRPLTDLQGIPLAADLLVGRDSPCAEVVYGFRGERVVHVLDLCEVGTDPLGPEVLWREEPREQLVALPPGAGLDAAPLTADVDGDGFLDLLIGGGGRTYVSYGDGARLQSEASALTIPFLGEPKPIAFSMPLAAGDITSDGVADFVLPSAVFGSRRSLVDSSIVYAQVAVNYAQPWSTAHVVDLNGNKLPDVIAGTKGVPGLSFLSGSGGPVPVTTRLSTRGNVSFLSSGDFNGDSIGDVAFVEEAATGRAEGALSIAYGARDKLPVEPVRIAELNGVQQLGRQRNGGLDDLFTTSTDVVGKTKRGRFTLFGGDASGLPIAPYQLVTFSRDGRLQDNFAPALLLGSFSAPDAKDVVAIGSLDLSKGWQQWLLPDIAAGEETPLLLEGEPPPEVMPITLEDAGSRLSVASAAADLDGDGRDEALWLMPQGKNGCALLTYEIDLHVEPAAARLESMLSFDEPCAAPELSVSDLDGDGRLDLLLLLGSQGTPSRPLRLLWNDGGGGFSVEDSSLLEDAGQRGVRAFSLFPKASAIAFVTDSALYIAKPHGRGSRSFDVVRDVKAFNDARSVVVTDPNGDGFDDMVIADAEGLWLLQAELR